MARIVSICPFGDRYKRHSCEVVTFLNELEESIGSGKAIDVHSFSNNPRIKEIIEESYLYNENKLGGSPTILLLISFVSMLVSASALMTASSKCTGSPLEVRFYVSLAIILLIVLAREILLNYHDGAREAVNAIREKELHKFYLVPKRKVHTTKKCFVLCLLGYLAILALIIALFLAVELSNIASTNPVSTQLFDQRTPAVQHISERIIDPSCGSNSGIGWLPIAGNAHRSASVA